MSEKIKSIFDPTYYSTETANGSPVRLVEYAKGPISVFSRPTKHVTVYIDLLNDADLELIESLGLPRWYFDFTGKGMTFQLYKQEYVSKTQLKALNLKTPWKHEPDKE